MSEGGGCRRVSIGEVVTQTQSWSAGGNVLLNGSVREPGRASGKHRRTLHRLILTACWSNCIATGDMCSAWRGFGVRGNGAARRTTLLTLDAQVRERPCDQMTFRSYI